MGSDTPPVMIKPEYYFSRHKKKKPLIDISKSHGAGDCMNDQRSLR